MRLTFVLALETPLGSRVHIHLLQGADTLFSLDYDVHVEWQEYYFDPSTGEETSSEETLTFGEWFACGGHVSPPAEEGGMPVALIENGVTELSRLLRTNMWLPVLLEQKEAVGESLVLEIATNLLSVPIHLLFDPDKGFQTSILYNRITHYYREMERCDGSELFYLLCGEAYGAICAPNLIVSPLEPPPGWAPLSSEPKALVVIGEGRREGETEAFECMASYIGLTFRKNLGATVRLVRSVELREDSFDQVELFAYVGHSAEPTETEWRDTLPLGVGGACLGGRELLVRLRGGRLKLAILAACCSFVPVWVGEGEPPDCSLGEACLFSGASFVVATQWAVDPIRVFNQLKRFVSQLNKKAIVARLHLSSDWECGWNDDTSHYDPSGLILFSDGSASLSSKDGWFAPSEHTRHKTPVPPRLPTHNS